MCNWLRTLIGLAIVLVILGIIYLAILLLTMVDWSNLEYGTVPNWITAGIAIIALCYSAKEYESHLKREKMETFAKYSERYSKDENIKIVTEFLIAYFENQDLSKFDLTINNKEMFLRFFEELEFQMEKGKLDQDTVENFFVYYAVAAAMCEPFIRHTELEKEKGSDNIWERYRKLISRYHNMESGISNDFIKHHPGSQGLSILIDYKKCHCCFEKLCGIF